MRKADIRRKPQLHKYGNKITIKQSLDEKTEAQVALTLAKSQSTSFIFLPKGFSHQFKKKNFQL